MKAIKSVIINTREDLDSLLGTVEHTKFMRVLKGTMFRTVDIQTYPEGYGTPDYKGEKIEPIWENIEDLSTIERFGFKKEDFNF